MTRTLLAAGAIGLLLGGAGCGNDNTGNSSQAVDNGGGCTPGDQDGVMGGNDVFLVNVSDTGFTVGGVDSGSTSNTIAAQNLDNITLTLTNTGTQPHDLVVECIPSGLPAACMTPTSCFPNPTDAGSTTSNAITLVPALQPGASQTVMFKAPLYEGVYTFISDVAGDDTTFESDGGASGNLWGQFVLT